MIRGANAYLDGFADKFTDIPRGVPCARLEGGTYNRSDDPEARCEIGMPPGVLSIVKRDHLVDEEMGVVNIFCRLGTSDTGMPDSTCFAKSTENSARSTRSASTWAAPLGPRLTITAILREIEECRGVRWRALRSAAACSLRGRNHLSRPVTQQLSSSELSPGTHCPIRRGD
jgi:hypothetical protein